MSNMDGMKRFRFRADLSFFATDIDAAMRMLGAHLWRDNLDDSMDFIGTIDIRVDDSSSDNLNLDSRLDGGEHREGLE